MKDKKFISGMKDWIFIILFIYLVVSVTVLFYINLALNQPLTLDTLNNWVSLILGLVATIFSVLSMWISFYSLEKSNEQNKENIHNMNSLKEEIINRVERTNEIYLQQFYEIKGKIDVTASQLSDIKETVNSNRVPLTFEKVVEDERGSIDEYDVKEDESQ